jgi:hypothetical protein
VAREQLEDARQAVNLDRARPLSFCKFYSRDRPLALMASDGNPKAVKFIQPNFFNCPGFSIGQYDAFPDKVGLRLLELGKDR